MPQCWRPTVAIIHMHHWDGSAKLSEVKIGIDQKLARSVGQHYATSYHHITPQFLHGQVLTDGESSHISPSDPCVGQKLALVFGQR